MPRDEIDHWLRVTLARLVGADPAEVAALDGSTPLLDPAGLGLGSLAGERLLAAVRDEYGVDIAAHDLALDSLESITTLRIYIAERYRS